MKKLQKIRIKSCQHAGRYVGLPLGTGLRANPELLKNPEVPIPGMKLSLYVQETAGTRFSEDRAEALQAELKKLGYESELITVEGWGAEGIEDRMGARPRFELVEYEYKKHGRPCYDYEYAIRNCPACGAEHKFDRAAYGRMKFEDPVALPCGSFRNSEIDWC